MRHRRSAVAAARCLDWSGRLYSLHVTLARTKFRFVWPTGWELCGGSANSRLAAKPSRRTLDSARPRISDAIGRLRQNRHQALLTQRSWPVHRCMTPTSRASGKTNSTGIGHTHIRRRMALPREWMGIEPTRRRANDASTALKAAGPTRRPDTPRK